MELTSQRIKDLLLDTLDTETEYQYSTGNNSFTYIGVYDNGFQFKKAKAENADAKLTNGFIDNLASNLEEAVPKTPEKALGGGGNSRSLYLSILTYTEEFYYLKRGRQTLYVWLPNLKHKKGVSTEITEEELAAYKPISDPSTPPMEGSSMEGITMGSYRKVAEDQILSSEQIIVYGTPGSGKSFIVNDTLTKGQSSVANSSEKGISYSEYLDKYTPVDKSIKSYDKVINKDTFWKKIKGALHLSKDYATISEINDPNEIEMIIDYLKNDPVGKDLNQKAESQTPSSACIHYKSYLTYLSDQNSGKGRIIKRTIFHPDTDFSNFVGSYKPTYDKVKDKITYTYTPQVFVEAYLEAWHNPEKTVYLIIEEINRGNCAQVFGSLFQLLDRKSGYSEYPVSPEKDLKDYLNTAFKGEGEVDFSLDTAKWDYQRVLEVKEGTIMAIPKNLHLVATMNTSDQSLFPMDSAFKRRWDWLYIPIDYEDPNSASFTIKIGEKNHSWIKFLKAINDKIYQSTNSEDKQMGGYFINPHNSSKSVDAITFVNKVVFYLWTEICKDEGHSKNNFFYTFDGSGNKRWFSFNQLFPIHQSFSILNEFVERIIKEYEEHKPVE